MKTFESKVLVLDPFWDNFSWNPVSQRESCTLFTCNPNRINRELMEQIDLSAAQIKSRDQEIERLKGELREATESLEATMAEEQVP